MSPDAHSSDGGYMRAAVLRGPRQFVVEQTEIPQPGAGQVRVRLEGCGVCGSDMPVWQGRPWFSYPRLPGSPGHEAWGRIDALGPHVNGLELGARVSTLSYHGYAEYDVADARTLVRLPSELDQIPFPGEVLACAMNVFERSRIAAGDTVAVIGVGFLGGLLVQLATRAGARVVAISRRTFALRMARELGAVAAFAAGDESIPHVVELTNGELCDVVIEAAGAQPALDLAGPLTKTRGRLVIAGFHQDGERIVDMQLWNWRGLDVINAHEREPEIYRLGMERAVEAVSRGRLDPTPLFTHRFPLPQVGAALDAVENRPEDFMKALITL